MCMFSRPVLRVAGTSIFARASEPGHQVLAYKMTLAARKELAHFVRHTLASDVGYRQAGSMVVDYGTPGDVILAHAARLGTSLIVMGTAGRGALGRALVGSTAERLMRERCGNEIRMITPSAMDERGCQLSFRVTGGPRRGRRIFDALAVRGVVCDWREPDIIRIAPVPLYNRFTDVFDLVEEMVVALKEIA